MSRSTDRGAPAGTFWALRQDFGPFIRHLTSDPPAMAARATAFLQTETELFLADLVVAETVYVLESSFYETPRTQVAQVARSRRTGEELELVSSSGPCWRMAEMLDRLAGRLLTEVPEFAADALASERAESSATGEPR